jgi:hypothetical protein
MFLAQLAAFLLTHHHAGWVHLLTSGPLSPGKYARILTWAARHGFIYQP